MNETFKGLQQYSPELEPAVFEFQRIAYPERDPAQIPDRWRWMFVESAEALGVKPRVWTYFRKGEMVAHQGAIPVACKIGSRTIDTGWFVETMVLEKARSGPIGATLVAKALEDMPFNLSLGQSPLMRELQFRLGWKKIGALQTYVFTVDAARIARARSGIGRTLLAAGLPLWGLVCRLRRQRHAEEGLSVQQVEKFGASHDALWERVAVDYTCAVRRDSGYLNWKFLRQPGQHFDCFEVRDADSVRGIIACRAREPGGDYPYRRLEITEVLVAPTDRAALFALFEQAVDRAREQKIPMVYLHISHRVLETAIAAFGFIRRPATRWLLLATATLDAADRETIEQPGNWLLTGSDSDIDRP